MVNLFIKVVNSMKKTINEDNFNDFYKLTRFIREKYYDYHNYLEKERSAVEMQFSGVFMNVPIPYELNEFFDFINSEIKRISLNNSVEKKKVM